MKVDPLLFLQAETSIDEAVKLMSNNFTSTNIIDNSRFDDWYDYKTEIQNAYNSNIIYASAILNQIKYDKISPTKEQLMSLDSSFAAINLQFQNSLLDSSNLTDIEKERLQSYNENEYNEEIKKLFANKKNLTKTEAATLYNVYLSEQERLKSRIEKEKNPNIQYDLTLELYKKAQEANNVLINYYNSKSWNTLSNEDIKIFQELKNQNATLEESSKLLESNKNLSKAQYNYENVKGLFNGKEKEKYKEQIKDSINEQIKSYEKLKSLTKDINEIKTYNEQIDALRGTLESYKSLDDALKENQEQWSKAVGSLIKGDFKSALIDVNAALASTIATSAVIETKQINGILNVVGSVVDGLVGIGGNLVAGVVDIGGNKELSAEIKDNVLDFQRREFIDEIEKNFFENTFAGKITNGFSTLKYNSEGAKSIESLSETGAKIAAATALTIFSGGLATAGAGFLYGAGKSGEEYAQSIDRENGEMYNHTEALWKQVASGLSEASSWYVGGRTGTQIVNLAKTAGELGVRETFSLLGNSLKESFTPGSIQGKEFAKSFVKNLFDFDNVLDTVAVGATVAGDVASGQSLDEALENRWKEAAFVTGVNVFSALLGAGMEVKSNSSKVNLDDATVDMFKVDDNIVVDNKILAENVKIVENIDDTVDSIIDPHIIETNLHVLDNYPNAIKNTAAVPLQFAGLAQKFSYKPVAGQEIAERITKDGLYHFTSKEAAEKILESGYVKASGNIASYGRKKAFFFAGEPTLGDVVVNVNNFEPTRIAVKFDADESQIPNFRYRKYNDHAVTFNGDYHFNKSNARIAYMGLVNENGNYLYKEISKAEFDAFNASYNPTLINKMANKAKVGLIAVSSDVANAKKGLTTLKDDFISAIEITKAKVTKAASSLFSTKNTEELLNLTGAKNTNGVTKSVFDTKTLKDDITEEIFKLDDITEPMSSSKNEFILKDDITLDDITEEIVELSGLDRIKQKAKNALSFTKAKVSETKSIFKENMENVFYDTKAKISKIKDNIFSNGAKSLENSKNLKNSIMKNMPANLTDEEKARYIYMELNKRVNYDANYALGNNETLKELTYNHELTLENFGNLNSDKVICKGWAELYQELLKESNINGTVKIMGHNSSGAHKWIEINLNNGKKIFADSTQSYANGFTDLVNCKSGNKTGGFLIFNNDIEINATGKTGIEQVKSLSSQADDLSSIDKKLGFTRNDRYYRDSLGRLEEKFKNDNLVNKLLGNNKIEKKVSKTVEMINNSKMGELETYSYMKRQKNSLFGDNTNIDMIMDSDSGIYRPILSYLDSNGTINYQIFTKGSGFESISKQELESLIGQSSIKLRDNKILGMEDLIKYKYEQQSF